MLRYLDQKKETIDWYASIRNLSSYGARTEYTMNHYKRCIDRWVSYFAPNMRPVSDNMDANEAASYLSSLTLPDNDVEIVEREICNMTRKIGEKLISKPNQTKPDVYNRWFTKNVTNCNSFLLFLFNFVTI
jgi:hypothetical protein